MCLSGSGAKALKEYDVPKGIDWGWQSLDGAMTKAPSGGKEMLVEATLHGFAVRRPHPQ